MAVTFIRAVWVAVMAGTAIAMSVRWPPTVFSVENLACRTAGVAFLFTASKLMTNATAVEGGADATTQVLPAVQG
jgi:hypothetical protein